MRLKDQLAVVTGGSRGLGAAICRALGREGAFVAVNYMYNEAKAQEVVDGIISKGGMAAAIRADVTDEAAVLELLQKAEAVSGRKVSILVNNATGPQPELSMEELNWKDYEDQLNFFVKAPFLLMKACLPSMKAQKKGSVINIGSEVVQMGNGHFSNYVTAKSAMLGMTRSWASEFGEHGIRVNLLNPGFIPVERHADVSGDAIEQYRLSIPLKRMGVPEDAANTAVYLASEESSFITGQSLSVNGGNTYGI
ncbi:SDR family oxidoreductase [Bacillus sp. FJAT-42376]|uniref:SDR family NAD(P)-dependent oxidoreductase n=1 Tax=Bacillus sp. FJAT-42376 TaxID=2014076 RepID=UPI000F510F5C|nr:SDR family oxidoreductase [Bacillus sp. FJAT-42376]AZB41619.1 SDR family oxidoreductase [Bacillus sp. FJAT-42376]